MYLQHPSKIEAIESLIRFTQNTLGQRMSLKTAIDAIEGLHAFETQTDRVALAVLVKRLQLTGVSQSEVNEIVDRQFIIGAL